MNKIIKKRSFICINYLVYLMFLFLVVEAYQAWIGIRFYLKDI